MWGYVPGLLLCFSSCSFGHELGAGMVNKQVLGTEVKEGLGEEPRPGFWRTVQGKGRTEGHCLQGALWSLAAYGNYLHAFATLGPVGDWGCWSHQPSEGDSCPTSASSQICTVRGLLFTGRRPKWPVQSPGWKKFRRGGSSHTQFLGPQLRVSRQRVVPTLWGVWPVQPSSCEAAVSSAHAPWYQPLASTQRGNQHEERLPPTLVSREATLELNKRSHSSGLGPPHPQLPKSQPPPRTLATKTSDGLSHTGALCFGTDHVSWKHQGARGHDLYRVLLELTWHSHHKSGRARPCTHIAHENSGSLQLPSLPHCPA